MGNNSILGLQLQGCFEKDALSLGLPRNRGYLIRHPMNRMVEKLIERGSTTNTYNSIKRDLESTIKKLEKLNCVCTQQLHFPSKEGYLMYAIHFVSPVKVQNSGEELYAYECIMASLNKRQLRIIYNIGEIFIRGHVISRMMARTHFTNGSLLLNEIIKIGKRASGISFEASKMVRSFFDDTEATGFSEELCLPNKSGIVLGHFVMSSPKEKVANVLKLDFRKGFGVKETYTGDYYTYVASTFIDTDILQPNQLEFINSKYREEKVFETIEAQCMAEKLFKFAHVTRQTKKTLSQQSVIKKFLINDMFEFSATTPKQEQHWASLQDFIDRVGKTEQLDSYEQDLIEKIR